jgi:GH25 family lysozyme M1 (1,4-beta-N-acetylmuramidase)
MPQDDPGEQANLFFRTVQPYLPMMLALDLEPAGHEDQGGGWAAQPVGRNISNVMAYLDELCKLVKGKPLIYTYNGFLNRFLTGIDLSAYGLWVPDPSNYHPIIPPPWKDWTLFQYSWTGKVPGITGDVDLNRFRGDAADFIELHYCGAA